MALKISHKWSLEILIPRRSQKTTRVEQMQFKSAYLTYSCGRNVDELYSTEILNMIYLHFDLFQWVLGLDRFFFSLIEGYNLSIYFCCYGKLLNGIFKNRDTWCLHDCCCLFESLYLLLEMNNHLNKRQEQPAIGIYIVRNRL